MWLLGVLLLSVTTINCDEDWSWGGNSKKKTEESLNNNTLIDNLLLSGRTGRHLDGFDEVYSDPEIQQALSTGNDSQARHYIKERLCGLGLMACDEDIEEKRPHVRPSDLIYAQPVHLRPVGHPITAIPVKGSPLIGSGGYGPPRPIPLASNSYGSSLRPPAPPPPPPRLHYGPPRGPVYSVSKPAAVFEREPEFHYRPPVTSTIDDKKPVVVVNTQQPGGNVQQHVHHHFHHDADKGLTSNTGVTASPIETIGINTDSISYPPLSSNYNPAFIPTGSGSGSSSLYGNSISGSNYASSYDGVNSYGGIGPFYKKKFNVHKGGYNTNGILASSSTYNSNSYPKYETPRADGGFNDCICVPYEQCPPHEIARKEDGYFIDPRTVSGSTIEALGPDEVVITDGNGTMTVVSKHTKREDNEHFDEDSSSDTELNEKAAEDKNIEPETSSKRKRREAAQDTTENKNIKPRQANYGFSRCPARQVCCRRPLAPPLQQPHYRPHPPTCGQRNTQGINGRIKNPVYVDGDSEFGEYPWQVAILKKDPQESVYVCGGTLIDNLHIITAAHCVKSYGAHDLRVRLGEWDVNHDVEFYPYIERDVQNVFIHPEFYAGTLYNDLAVIRIDRAVDFTQSPHISPACLPEPYTDYSGQRCWTTGWGKDAFGDYGKYQNILKEVDVPIVSFQQCQLQLQQTRLGYEFKLHPGFVCAGGEEGKDACKGDGGGPMVCERNGSWQVVGVVSWGIGCGQYGVPGVYVKVAHYLDWIKQITNQF
ncbi:uncharacterized protein LOC142326279 isoform X3 [Lycorma delicatula]|uniref:uncharacterized protein LOC142326279 isoform X3 n=1 Tax=Lycorma delicatula TaxID=130591 RepID=UPI003F512230